MKHSNSEFQHDLRLKSSNVHTNAFHASFPTILPHNQANNCLIPDLEGGGTFRITPQLYSLSQMGDPLSFFALGVWGHLDPICLCLGTSIMLPGCAYWQHVLQTNFVTLANSLLNPSKWLLVKGSGLHNPVHVYI